ncbi:MAG: alpha/beta fold hydrolase, partial [Chlamydiia bacterium]|nr:alpha/beta fold hydrolase [Chlamydiia bacterium]
MPFAKINGIEIYYETHGEGFPLIFISGFATHHLTWNAFIKPLQSQYRMILLDNRGAGQSSAPPPPYTIEMMAEDVVGLMDFLGIEKGGLVGSSMGTAIVQTIAKNFPERVVGGALIAPFARLPAASQLKSLTTGKLLAQKAPLELVIETVIPWLFSRDFVACEEKVAKRLEEMVNNPFPQKGEGFLGQMAALKAFDSRPFLSELTSPFLLIPGEEDLSTPLSCAQEIHEKLPNTILHSFPRVGYMVHAERQSEVLVVFPGNSYHYLTDLSGIF